MPSILWITDLHLDPAQPVLGLDSVAACRRAVDHLVEHFGDASCCVVTGDIANHGTREAYAAARRELDRLPMPCYPLVGNHDDRDTLRAHFELHGSCMSDFVQYTADLDNRTRILCLDTLVPGEAAGELCEARMTWLREALEASAGRELLVFQHHPPAELGMPAFDAIGLRNSDELVQLLACQPNLRYVCAGHVHRAHAGVRSGVPFATQRSVLFQAPPPRPAWDFSRFAPADEPAGFGLIRLDSRGVQIEFNQFPHNAESARGQQ